MAEPLREMTCLHCRRPIWWIVDGLNPNGVWLDDYHIAVATDGHRHTPASCLGCGQVGTRAIWHEPTGIYLCAQRCVPAIRAAVKDTGS